MSVLDIREPKEKVDELQWSDEGHTNLKHRAIDGSATLDNEFLYDLYNGNCNMVESAEEAENLAAALLKAVELGWFK